MTILTEAMKTNATLISTLLIAAVATLAGCKKTDVNPAAIIVPPPVAATPAASAPAPVAAASAPAVAGAASTFDINSVPVTTAAPPPFPYLDWPAKLPDNARRSEDSDFDRVYMVAGTDLRPVEGRVSVRTYSLSGAKLSQFAAERNYDNALKAIGAVAVSKMQPNEKAFTELHPEVKDT